MDQKWHNMFDFSFNCLKLIKILALPFCSPAVTNKIWFQTGARYSHTISVLWKTYGVEHLTRLIIIVCTNIKVCNIFFIWKLNFTKNHCLHFLFQNQFTESRSNVMTIKWPYNVEFILVTFRTLWSLLDSILWLFWIELPFKYMTR